MKKTKVLLVLMVLISIITVFAVIGMFFFLKSTPVFSSEHFSVSKKMLSYYTEFKKNEYIEYYSENYGEEYLESIKLDPDKPLKDQESGYGGTWYDYFYSQSEEELKRYLLCCEAAKQNGLEVSTRDINAKSEEFQFSNTDNNKEEIEKLAEICLLAEKYLSVYKETIDCSEERILNYYNENRSYFDCVDLYCIEVFADYDENEGVNSEVFVSAMNKAKKDAENLVNLIKNKGYDAAVKDFSAKIGRDNFEETFVCGYKYENNTRLGDWAFQSQRKSGDIEIFKGNGQYSVYYLKEAAYPYDYTVKKIQVISLDGNRNSDNANKIFDLYEQFETMENNESNFKLLAQNLNQSAEITQVSKEELSEQEIKWIYSEKRSVGDYSIVENNNIINLIRYCGDGDSYFNIKVKESLIERNIEEMYKRLSEKFALKK